MSCRVLGEPLILNQPGIPVLIDFLPLLAFVQDVQLGGPPVVSVLERHVHDF